jgi:hypothetical protein
MMSRFCGYIDKVFDFGEQLATLHDSRPQPQISAQAVFSTVFALLASGQKSLNAVEPFREAPRRLRFLIGPHMPSADTLGRVYAQMDSQPLREMLSQINHQIKRNKALSSAWPLTFAALDGHEFFASRRRCCDQCSQRTVTVHGEPVTEYYHRGVVCHLIGFDLALPLDVEMQRPGEGEVPAAKRLLERVLQSYGRFFDAVAGDALYLEAPFMNFCRQHGKHVVAVIKGDQRLLLQDAQGLFSQREPHVWRDAKSVICYWDEEHFTSCEGVCEPLRVLHTEERYIRRQRHGNQWREVEEEHTWWWATTIPKRLLSSRELWLAGHSRWDVENDCFNTLSVHGPLDHCFKHDPTAIVNFVLTLFIVYVLLQSFYRRNLKPQRRRFLTLTALRLKLYAEMDMGVVRPPWQVANSRAPP